MNVSENELEQQGVEHPAEAQPANEEAMAEARRAEEYLSALQRERADFLNYKRRAEQERSGLLALGALTAVQHFLPVLDDLDRAVQSVDEQLAQSSWVQGIVAVHRKAVAALESLGVKEIQAQGAPFDPRTCEAVLEGDGPANTVVAVLQRGYTMGDQVIRPARVMVGRDGGPGAGGEEATADNDEQQEGAGRSGAAPGRDGDE